MSNNEWNGRVSDAECINIFVAAAWKMIANNLDVCFISFVESDLINETFVALKVHVEDEVAFKINTSSLG